MKYKAAVVGCGRIGFEFDKDPKRKYLATHTGAYNYVKETELVAVCDVNRKRLKECVNRWGISAGYSNFKEMLKKERIDILSICTPPSTHYHILKEAVKHPLKAIFCEKPIADSVKDAKKMVKLCKEKNIILQIDHQRRFDPLHVDLREFIKSKEVGDVQQVNVYYTAGVNNTGSHMFDLMRFFFGKVDWIEGLYSKNVSRKKNDPNIDGFMRFKSGVFASFQACDVTKYLILELNCFLGKGRVILKNSGFGVDFYKVGDGKLFSGYKELYKSRAPFQMNYKRNFMVDAIRHIQECIKTGKESISSGENGVAVLETIMLAVSSAKNNGKRMFFNRGEK